MRREHIAPLLLLLEWRAVGRALKLLPRVAVDGHCFHIIRNLETMHD